MSPWEFLSLALILVPCQSRYERRSIVVIVRGDGKRESLPNVPHMSVIWMKSLMEPRRKMTPGTIVVMLDPRRENFGE